MSNNNYIKPLPEPTLDSKPFWEALKRHSLELQKCPGCGKIRHYPRPVCDQCFSMEVEWIKASGRGKVFSWTVAHHPFHPGFKAEIPYVLVTVELEEGVRMVSQLKGATAEEMKIGLPVEVVFEDVTAEFTLPMFRPILSGK